MINLRGQSIDGQINGTIPSTATEQNNSEALIDASHIDLSVMGTMNMGGGFSRGDSKTNNDIEETEGSEMPQFESEMPEGFDPSQFGGEMPEGFDPSQFGGEMPEGNMPFMNYGENSTNNLSGNLILFGVYFLVLIAGLLFAMLFKRKKYRR